MIIQSIAGIIAGCAGFMCQTVGGQVLEKKARETFTLGPALEPSAASKLVLLVCSIGVALAIYAGASSVLRSIFG